MADWIASTTLAGWIGVAIIIGYLALYAYARAHSDEPFWKAFLNPFRF